MTCNRLATILGLVASMLAILGMVIAITPYVMQRQVHVAPGAHRLVATPWKYMARSLSNNIQYIYACICHLAN